MLDFEKKICASEEIQTRLALLPRPIVFTNGVFDILHRGHVSYLAQARALGASLIVAVNTDDSVRSLAKGPERPLNPCEDRMAVVAALESVSLVVPFIENTALELIKKTHPDIYVKGADYDIANTPEGRYVLSYGGKIEALTFKHIRSTSALVDRIRSCMLNSNFN